MTKEPWPALLHFSPAPLSAVEDRTDPREGWRQYHKPYGLWLSVGEAWLDWCRGERFRLEEWQFSTPVFLRSDAHILRLPHAMGLRTLTDRYHATPYPSAQWGSHIDWPRVMAEYDGILIDPYDWDHRLELMWYYGWDVASGCIWRTRAIATLGTPAPVPPPPPEELD